MDLGLGNTLLPGDPRLIDHIVGEVKSQGIFDQFRKDALADVDTKPAYQNLRTRVEGSVNAFLAKQSWKADLNKNQLRETLRKHISDAPYLDTGVERIVDQVVNPKIYSVFMPEIEDVVYKFLGIERPKREKEGTTEMKDLLPVDLDPVSPESDKNSLKDVSLDSVDAKLSTNSNSQSNDVDKVKDASKESEDNKVDVKEDITTDSISTSTVTTPTNSTSNTDKPEINDSSEVIVNNTEEEKRSLPSPFCQDNNLNEVKVDEREETKEVEDEEDLEDEEEEASPVFEPIELINMNESNDSHLSGISGLTSHRSRSPDFNQEFSRDHFDFSNQDSQFSKVSSDSRLSIVTDCGSSNQASTPKSDTPKEDKDKGKDGFKGNENEDTMVDSLIKQKDDLIELKDESDSKISSSKESSRDASESGIKEKSENKDREKHSESSKKSKERSSSRDSRSHRDRDHKRKSGESRHDSKGGKEKSENSRDSDKSKDSKESSTKAKEEKMKENSSKETKDLKDIYKEKIRELREKKELTEKEKLKEKESKDSKDHKENRDSKDGKESKDKRDSRDKKDHRSSSSSSRSHSSSSHHDRKRSSSKDDSKSSRDKSRSHSKDSKSKSSSSDSKRSSSRSDKRDSQSSSKSSSRKSSKSESQSRSSDKYESSSDSKDKKRRDDKKSKSKDDHPSQRKHSNDRRSSDRDGSNGKSNDKSNSSPGSSSKTNSSLNKESSNTSNSGGDTSDSVEESQMDQTVEEKTNSENTKATKIELGLNEISLPFKKRPVADDDASEEVPLKKLKSSDSSDETKKLLNIQNVPDEERVQIIEVEMEDEDSSYVERNKQSDDELKEEDFINPDILSSKSRLSEMELSIKQSLNEMMMNHSLKQDDFLSKFVMNQSKNISNVESNLKKRRMECSSDEDCQYFIPNVEAIERHKRFKKYLKTIGVESEINDDEDDISNELNPMAPPQLKHNCSTSPLSIFINNLNNNHNNNNNESHKLITTAIDEENNSKKKKTGRRKKNNISSPPILTNGDNFVMPLSPESDVSGSGEKITLQPIKEEKVKQKSSQRYTSDDLYKPRSMFMSSSRRNRKINS